jgi:hypothetical protein
VKKRRDKKEAPDKTKQSQLRAVENTENDGQTPDGAQTLSDNPQQVS